MHFLRTLGLLLAAPLLLVGMCAAQGYPLVNTTTGTYDTQTPAYVGQGANHICWVDGVINTSAADCVTGFSATQSSGIIQGIMESLTSNPFAGSGSWTWVLPNGLNSQTCPSTAPYNCVLLNAPLVLASGSDIIGVGIVTASQTYAQGTAFSFGSNFPSALGQPTTPTATCGTTPAGFLSNGAYYIVSVQANDLNGGAGGSSANTPGFTIASAQQTVTCAAGGSVQSIQIAAPTVQASTNSAFTAKAVYLCGSTTSGGPYVCGSASIALHPNMLCSVADPMTNDDGCGITGTTSLLAIPNQIAASQTNSGTGAAAGGSLVPPLKDTTNPLIVIGALKPTTGASGNFLSRFSVMGNSTLGPLVNFGVPAANEPNIGIWLRTTQENTILQGVGVFGPWGGYCTTAGTGCGAGGTAITGGGSGIYVTKGSNQINGSESICIMNSTLNHYLCDPITVDGNMLFGNPQLGIDGTSMNTRQTNSTANASALVSGTGTKVTFTHSHFENSVNPTNGDLVQVTSGATATVLGGDGCCAVNGLHITSSAVGASAVNFANSSTNPVEDDLNGDPTVPSPVNYTSIASWASGGMAVGSGHLNQVASKNFAGSCSMSSATTCTFSITTAFTGTPLAFASLDPSATLPATANPVKCSVSGTTVTIRAFTSNSLKWDCVLIGNPN